MRSIFPLASWIVAFLATAPLAQAQPKPKPDRAAEVRETLAKKAAERLAQLVNTGNEQCERGEIDEGIRALSSAFSQKPEPAVAASLGACEVSAKQWARAADHLAFALRGTEEGPEHTRIEGLYQDVRKRVGAVKLIVNIDEADVFVQNRYVGQSPLPNEVHMDPGRSVIVAKRSGYEETEKTVTLGAATSDTLTLTLAPVSTTGNRYAVAPRTRVPFYVLGTLALLAGGAGGGLAVAALTKASAADELLAELGSTTPCRTGPPGCATVLSLRQHHDTLMNAGTGAFIGGGVLLGAAMLYGVWAFQGPGPSSTGSLRWTPEVSRDGGTVWVQGTF